MHDLTFLRIFLPIAALAACQLDPANLGTPDSDSETTASSTSTTDTAASATDASAGTGADDTAATGPGMAAGTDTDTTGPGMTTAPQDTGDTLDTDTDTDTGGAGGCAAPDPATAADFEVALDGWPGQTDEEHDVERVCTIDGVTDDGEMVTTAVTCDVDGVPLSATFAIATAPEGAVDWAIGQSVTLRAYSFADDFGSDIRLRVTLAENPAVLLVDGQDWWGDSVPKSQTIGPIERQIAMTCEVSFDEQHYVLSYSLVGGPSVTIMSGHRDALALDATHAFAIDLAQVGVDCCHGSEHSLIRRVKL